MRSMRLVIPVALFLFVIVGCQPPQGVTNSTVSDQLERALQTDDQLVAIGISEFIQHTLCSSDQAKPSTQKSIDKSSLIELLQKKLNTNNQWEKLETLKALIICKAEGINVTVIDSYRQETNPTVRKQIMEMVALYSNVPLQREIATRTMRSNDLATKALAFNLMLAPYFHSQLKGDKSRIAGLAERLSTNLDPSTLLIAAKNLKYLNAAGEVSYAEELLENVHDSGASFEERLNSLAMLALSGSEIAKETFDEILEKGSLETKSRRRTREPAEISKKAVRYAKLGAISTNLSAPKKYKNILTPSNISEELELIDVLFLNTSPEASQYLIDGFSQRTGEIQSYIVSALFDHNDWSPETLAELYLKASTTNKIVIEHYLNTQTTQEYSQKVRQLTLKNATPKELKEILAILRHHCLTTEGVKATIPLQSEIQKRHETETQPELKKELEFLLRLQKIVDGSLPVSEDELMSAQLDEKFQMALVSNEMGQLSPNMTNMLQNSDNLFLRLSAEIYKK